MPFDRTCEVCKKSFQVPSRTQKGRFCSKVCMDSWQRSATIEERYGEEQAKKMRETRRQRWIDNNLNNNADVLAIKSTKMTEYRKTHPLDGEKNPFYGRTHSDELKEKFRTERAGKRFYNDAQFARQNANTPKGENHPMWKGGISFDPYDPRWTKTFRKQIRKRDGNRCAECLSEGKLAVHHIDYNKLNTVPSNCITLCFRCHGKTNVLDRTTVTKYFQEKYKEKLNESL